MAVGRIDIGIDRHVGDCRSVSSVDTRSESAGGLSSRSSFLLQLASFPAESEQFHVEENDTLARKANFERLLDKLKHYEGVKYTTFILNGQYPSSNSTSNGNTMFDTIPVRTLRLTFMPHTDYFRTMGMEGAEGMTAEQLDNRDFRWTESVLTADVAYRLKDGKPLYGRRLGKMEMMKTIGWEE